MVPIARMSPAELASYSPIRGAFLDIDCTFYGCGRTLGWYGSLDLDDDGLIYLHHLLVACSGERADGETAADLDQLRRGVAARSWAPSPMSLDILRTEESEAWEWAERPGAADPPVQLVLRLLSSATDRGTPATHLVLHHGCTDRLEEKHAWERFVLARQAPGDVQMERSHYYPVLERSDPDAAERLSADELAARLRGVPFVALTGAGVSRASGIPAFAGPGSLSRCFPLVEPFPGRVADWMIHQPIDLVREIGGFHARFLMARPNRSHFALAQLEKTGALRCVITGNGDRLHQRAGSRKVHEQQAKHFVGSDEGWGWVREGSVLIVVGVARDEHGIISYARDHELQIAALGPEPPAFLCARDWYVPGSGEDVLPSLAALLV